MCGCNRNCCPDAEIFQEQICGDLKGPLTFPPEHAVWTAPAINDYIQGTFEVFNAGNDNIFFQVKPFSTTDIVVLPGNSVSISVNNPTELIVVVPEGTHGKFCITLYKRLFG